MNSSHEFFQREWTLFFKRADEFLDKTSEYVHLGVNPGGYYKAIWLRDAAYILKDQFLTGDTYNVLRALYFIWSHQIGRNLEEKIIYGRGSPELKFTINHADNGMKEKFRGALPSTIYHNQGYSEIYARNPDIDSTALMVSTTSWILDVYLKAGLYSYHDPATTKPLSSAGDTYAAHPHNGTDDLSMPGQARQRIIFKPVELIEFIVPRMLEAVDYLASRDIDNDGLIEQGYNEDWMDTALRAGKIVYNQASWILATSNLSSLLYEIGEKNIAGKLAKMAERTVNAVEEKLWSEQDGAYIDIKYDGTRDENIERMLTQDVSLYLVSITENTLNDSLSSRFKRSEEEDDNDRTSGSSIKQQSQSLGGKRVMPRVPRETIKERASMTLQAIKDRIWLNSAWPLITEKELQRTGPWILDPNQYHNHTFWPWITGIEILARSRFQRYDECNKLLSVLTRENPPHALAYYEWVNPITGKGNGAFPFRTGISTIRMALTDILLSHV
ncbi:MAG TPA: hypothetical protein VF172_06505 [Nitrososphaera sp.]|jgi:hypothetical protein